MWNQPSVTNRVQNGTDAQADPWTSLYRIAAVAALISAVFIPIQIAVFIANPFPSDAAGWFALFQRNKLIGLIDLDVLLVADNLLLIPLFLALYVALHRTSQSSAALGATAALLAIPLFIASNPAFEMLSLSDRYAVAATDAERSALLAAGQTMLASWQGTAFQAGYLLSSIGGLIIAAVMLRSRVFGRATAYAGLLTNGIGLGIFVPAIGLYLAVLSVLPLEVWYVLLGLRLFQLCRPDETRGDGLASHGRSETAYRELARRTG